MGGVTREQMIDKAVRQVFIRPGMKRPHQAMKVIVNRADLWEAFHRGEPNDGQPPWSLRWYRPVGMRCSAALIPDLVTLTVTAVAMNPRTGKENRTVAWVKYYFRRIALANSNEFAMSLNV